MKVLIPSSIALMDGFEATRRIRQHSNLQDLKVIGISASVSSQIRQESLEPAVMIFLTNR